MNRIRGSVIAKIIAWLLLIPSAVFFVGSSIGVVIMEDYGVFRLSKEAALENELSDVSYSYSTRALAKYRDGFSEENEKYFEDKAFRYGIIEAENLDGIDLNDEKSYLMRNFANEVNQDELYSVSFHLTENSEIWYSDDMFGEHGYFADVSTEQALYADLICYDKAGGIFYYRAEGKYYPIQNLCLRVTAELKEGIFYSEDFNFSYDNNQKVYVNEYAINNTEREISEELSTIEGVVSTTEAVVEEATAFEVESMEEQEKALVMQPSVEYESKELAVLCNQEKITFNIFDGTELDYTKLGSIVFDGIRRINASELTIIDSKTIPQSSFVEVVYAYLDEYYTLHVQEKNEETNYIVVSFIDQVVLESKKQEFLREIGSDSWDIKLEAVLMANDIDAYVRKSILVDVLYEIKENIIGMMFGTFLLAIGCGVFLLCAAGHRRKREEIVPTFIDKIPLDFLFGVVFFAEVFAVVIMAEVCNLDSIPLVIQLCVGIGALMACLAMMTLLSLAVRMKMGKWWRNSILYWIFAKIRCLCVMLWKNIGILWKVILGVCIFAVIAILTGFCMFGDELVVVIFVFVEVVVVGSIFIVMTLQFRKLQDGSRLIAEGNLQHKIDTKGMFWEFRKHAVNLNSIGEGMSHAVDERMKSERFKTELITNVSHDIKTPLTSIINYVDLLQKTDIQDETAKEYLEVLERQSARLKKLIEDLIEASKASTGNLAVSMEELEAKVFVTQILGEFEEKVANAGLELIINKPVEEIPIRADGRHLWRVVDNLMNNICKYAQPGSRVYINLEETQDKILMTFRNMSKYPLNITSDELMERFVRGDSSRNTEGNGLGLSIAKSLMEIMNGQLLLYVDGDLFKVVLVFSK